MSEAELQALCEEWQKRLRLVDWRVRVEKKKHGDMMAGKAGTVDWFRDSMSAVIEILDPEQAPSGLSFPTDVEQTLVHELLHIPLATFWKEEGTPENIDLEQAINRIADALVRLKREAQVCGRAYDGKCPMPRPEPVIERREHVQEQMIGEPSLPPDCARCGQPINDRFDEVGVTDHRKPRKAYHGRCYDLEFGQ